MSNSRTCYLTEEKARAVCKLRRRGWTYRRICKRLRKRGLRIWPADISNWRDPDAASLRDDAGQYSKEMFRLSMLAAEKARAEEIKYLYTPTVRKAIKDKLAPAQTRNLLNALKFEHDSIAVRHLHLSGKVEGDGPTIVNVATYENEAFDDSAPVREQK